METATTATGIALFAYFVGSVPVAYLIARAVGGLDIRLAGEGNVGARNVFHEVGTHWGIITFLGDFAKGSIVAVALADAPRWQLALGGLFVLVGHAFPVWLGFLGGKGLSTVGGFGAVLLPWATLLGAVGAGAVWALTRRFMPTLVTVIVVTLVVAPAVGHAFSRVALVFGLFVLVGVKRALDEPRMRDIEAATGWDRLNGGTAS